jgi:hypothetical protein
MAKLPAISDFVASPSLNVCEPSTWAVILLGFASLGFAACVYPAAFNHYPMIGEGSFSTLRTIGAE